MTSLIEAADAFRRDLLASERATLVRMIDAYSLISERLKRSSDALLSDLRAAIGAGVDITLSWLVRQQRYRELLEQIEVEIDRYSQMVGQEIISLQSTIVARAHEAAFVMMLASIGPGPSAALAALRARFNQVPPASLRELVGMLPDGSPLSTQLDAMGEEARRAMAAVLMSGIATGQSSTTIAHGLRSVRGEQLDHALGISSAAAIWAAGMATHLAYTANRDMLSGWVWRSAADRRTCPVCWAQHGRVFPVDQPFASHRNCRCVMVPLSRSWSDLGFDGIPDHRPSMTTGSELFARLPFEQQRFILGPGKHAIYRSGELTLADVVGVKQHPRWGPVLYERSLRDLVGRERAARLIQENRRPRTAAKPSRR